MNRKRKLLRREPLKPAPTPADVAEEAERQGVDPVLAVSVALAESGGKANALSRVGARGPMQVMPETGKRRARELGEKYDPNDPHQNVRLGVRELKDATDQFETTDEAVAAYNAGAGAVKRHRGIPPYKETREYVPRVRQNYEQIQRRIKGLGDVFAIADGQGQETAATGAQTDEPGNIVNLDQAQQRLAQNEMRTLSRREPSGDIPDTFRREMTNEPTIQDFPQSAPNVLSRKPATTRRIVKSAQPGQNATGLGESDEPRLMPSADDVEQVSPDMRTLGETGARSLNQRFSEQTSVRRLTLPSGLGRAITTANDVEAQTLAKDAFVNSHQGRDREAATFLAQFVTDGFFDKRPQPQFNGKDGSYTLELAEPAWWSRALEAYRQGGKEQALAQVRDDAARLDEIERSRVAAEQGVKNEQARLKDLENTGVLQGGQYGEGLTGGLQAAAQGALSGTQDAIAAVAGLPGQVEALFSDNYYNPEEDNAVARLFRGAAARTGGASSGEATPNAGVLRRYAGAGGSMVPYLTTGLATGGSSLAVGALGAAQNASALQREAIEAGGTPDQIRTAYGAGAAVGSLEGALGFKGEAPIARAGLRAGAKEVGKQFVEESGQEGVSQGLNNVVASDIAGYERKRKWHQGVFESMIVGGVLGGGLSAGMVGAQAIVDRWTPEQAEAVGRIIERSGMQAEQIAAAPQSVQKTIIDQTRAMMAFEADYETLMQQLERERSIAQAGQQRAASGFVPTPIEEQAAVKAQQLEQQSADLLQQARLTQDNLNQIGAQLAFESQRRLAEQQAQQAQQQAQQAQQVPEAVAPQSSDVLSARPMSDEVAETQQPAPVSQPAPVASSSQGNAPSELLSDLAGERTAAIRNENQIAPGQNDEVTSLIEPPVDLFAEIRKAGGLEQTKDLAGELGQFGAKELGTTGLVRGDGKGLKTDTLRGDFKSEGKSQAENVDDFLQELEAEKRYRRFRRVNDQWSDKAWKQHVEKWAEDQGEFDRLTTQLAKYPELESRVLDAYEEGLTSDEYQTLYTELETGLGRDDASRVLHYLINRGAGFRKADTPASSPDAEYDGRSGRSRTADGATDAETTDGQELTPVRSNPIPEWMRGRDIYKMSGKELTEFILDLRAEKAQMMVAVQGDVNPGLRSTVNEILDAANKRRNEMKARQSALKKAKQTVPENEVVPAFDEKRIGGTKTGKSGLAQKLIEAQQQGNDDEIRSTDVQSAPVVEAGQNDAGDAAKQPDNNDGTQVLLQGESGQIPVSDANVSPSNNSQSQDVAPDESLAPIGRVRPDEITIVKSARDYRVHLPFGHDAFLRANRSKLGAFDPKTETWPVAKGRVEQIADAIAYWFGLPVRVEGRDAVWTPPADSPALRSKSESDYPKIIRDNQEAVDRLGEISLMSDEAGTLLDQIYEYTVINGIAKRHYDALLRTLMQMHKNEAQQLDDKERYDERKAINEAAHEAATSPQNDLPEPTQGQKEAGNYKKGHIVWNGLDLSIENPIGSERSGVDADGEKWSVKMSAHYGYIKRTEGADGEHVDIYLSDESPDSSKVFVIDQIDPKTGKFDEHKVVAGVDNDYAARRIYDAHFDDGSGPQRRAYETEMSVEEFKEWLKTGDTSKPVHNVEKRTIREINADVFDLVQKHLKQGGTVRIVGQPSRILRKETAGDLSLSKDGRKILLQVGKGQFDLTVSQVMSLSQQMGKPLDLEAIDYELPDKTRTAESVDAQAGRDISPGVKTLFHAKRAVGDVKDGPSLGVFFTEDEAVAKKYAGKTGSYAAYDVTVKKAMLLTADDSAGADYASAAHVNSQLEKAGVDYKFDQQYNDQELWRYFDDGGTDFIKAVKRAGYDSIAYTDAFGAKPFNSWLVFDKKSAQTSKLAEALTDEKQPEISPLNQIRQRLSPHALRVLNHIDGNGATTLSNVNFALMMTNSVSKPALQELVDAGVITNNEGVFRYKDAAKTFKPSGDYRENLFTARIYANALAIDTKGKEHKQLIAEIEDRLKLADQPVSTTPKSDAAASLRQDLLSALDDAKEKGVELRVKDLGQTMRVNLDNKTRQDVGTIIEETLNELGYTGPSGRKLDRYNWNGSTELNAYKPGVVERVDETSNEDASNDVIKGSKRLQLFESLVTELAELPSVVNAAKNTPQNLRIEIEDNAKKVIAAKVAKAAWQRDGELAKMLENINQQALATATIDEVQRNLKKNESVETDPLAGVSPEAIATVQRMIDNGYTRWNEDQHRLDNPTTGKSTTLFGGDIRIAKVLTERLASAEPEKQPTGKTNFGALFANSIAELEAEEAAGKDHGQTEFDPAQHIQLVADSVAQIRAVDVPRLFDDLGTNEQTALFNYLVKNRPDLRKAATDAMFVIQPITSIADKPVKPAKKKASTTTKEKKPAKPRTAGGAAKDAVIETAQGLSDVFEGLAKLIGDDRSMSSGGFAMDEKTYQAAKPYFIKASQHFMSAKVSAQEAMTLFLRALRDEAKFTIAMMKKLQPLIIRFMEEQEAGLNADESPTRDETEHREWVKRIREAFQGYRDDLSGRLGRAIEARRLESSDRTHIEREAEKFVRDANSIEAANPPGKRKKDISHLRAMAQMSNDVLSMFDADGNWKPNKAESPTNAPAETPETDSEPIYDRFISDIFQFGDYKIYAEAEGDTIWFTVNRHPEFVKYGHFPISEADGTAAFAKRVLKEIGVPAPKKQWTLDNLVVGIVNSAFQIKKEMKAEAEKKAKRDAAAKPDDQPTTLFDIAEKPKTEFERVSDAVYDELKAGRKLDNPKLRTIADKIYGGTQMSGKYQMKDAYDAVELAVNRIISENADIYMAAGVKPLDVFNKLRNLMAQLPTQASDMRTAEQQKFQQFSTPPQLAFLAAKVLNPTADDVIVEPSAGTGSLAVFARGTGAKVYANEISERRRNALKALDFETSGVDAEFLHSLLPKHIQPSAVIMNPPFSSTGDRGLTNSSKFGARHVREALLRLKEGGRLVAIVSDGMGLDKARMTGWWTEILDNYTVRADVSISGQEYAKYGTTYDNRLLVIDKTGPTPGNATPFQIAHVLRGRFEKIEDAYEALQKIADARNPAKVEKPARDESNSDTAESGNGLESNAGPTDGRGGSKSSGAGSRGGGTRSGRSGRGGSSSGATRSGRSGGKLPKGKSGVAGQENEQPENGNSNADNEQSGRVEFGPNPAALERQQDETGTFITYQPAKIIGGAPHPAIIVEAASMGAIDPPDPTYQPNLPQSTLERGISNVQVESVVYAGQRHELRMRNGARAGFFIGDGTGVGKGRQISAIILDNWRQGRRRAVWFSTGQQLAESAERDLKGVGAGHLPLYIIHDAAAGEEIKFGDGVLFATYSMIAKQAGEGKMTRLEQIEKWLGDDGVIVFDEGHKAKNAVSGQQGGEGTQTGEAVVSIQNDLPNARVVYASATGATDVRNMAYMERLGLWGVGTPFPGGFADFWREVEGGGYGAMEMVARDMKALGAYLSRSISFGVDPESGLAVEYRKQVHELTPNQEEVYDAAAEVWQEVLKNIDTALVQTNGGNRQKARAMAQFYGAQQRFFRSLITAAKVPTAIELTNKALAEGKQVVISIIGTGETAQKKQVAGAKASGIDLEDLDFSPRQTLLDYIDRSFPVLQYVQVQDPATGVVTTSLLTDEHGNPVENAEAVALRSELKEKLAGLRLPESPLDQLVNYFEETAGGVAELTGRKKRLMRDPKTGKLELQKRAPVSANKINEYEMGQFQSGKKRVAIISQAAAEGISLHAEKSAPSREARRVQITLELDWSADKQMQTFGRTHRTNQTMPPEFVLLASNIGGEARFIATIARRLSSLGALTKGQRDAAGGGSDFADFNYESPIGEGATYFTIDNLHSNRVPGIPDGPILLEKMGMLDSGGQVKPQYREDVTAFLNRILALPLKKQNLVFEHFATAFQRIVERQKEQGTFDAGVTDIRAVSIKRSSEPVEIAKEPISGAKTYANELELELPTYPVAFSEANRHAVDPTTESSFARYKGKTERLVLVRKAIARTDKQTGAVIEQVSLTSPAEDRFTYIDKSKLEENWELITPDEARAQWEEQFSQVPATETHKTYVMSGALLPIWQILRGDKATRLSIVRVPFENGERLVGVRLSVPQARRVMRALGLQSQKRTPQEIYDAVKGGESVVLMGGNRLVLKRFRGEPVIQVLTGDAYMNRRPFLEMGLIENRNFSSSEYYVPNDPEKGVEVLDRLLGSYPEIIQTGTKASELPAASRRVSQVGSVTEIIENAALTIKEPKGSRPARLYGNDHFMAILRRAVTRLYGRDYGNASALTLSGEHLNAVAQYLEQQADADGMPAALAEKLADLAGQLYQTVTDFPQTAYAVVDGSFVNDDNLFTRSDSKERFKQDVREEQFHWAQRAVGGNSIALTGASWASKKLPKKIAQKLIEAGYANDPELLVAEIAAHIAAGNFAELGVFTDGKKLKAYEWLAEYFARVAEVHGQQALAQFKHLPRDAAQAKTSGAQIYAERVIERSRSGNSDGAKPRTTSDGAGRRGGDLPVVERQQSEVLSADEKTAWGNRPIPTENTAERQNPLGDALLPVPDESFGARPVPTAGISERQQPLGDARLPVPDESFNARPIPTAGISDRQQPLGDARLPVTDESFNARPIPTAGISDRQQPLGDARLPVTDESFNARPIPTTDLSEAKQPPLLPPSLRSSSSREAVEGLVPISDREIQRWRKQVKLAMGSLAQQGRIDKELQNQIWDLIERAETAIETNDGARLVQIRQETVKLLQSRPTVRGRLLDVLNLPKALKASFDLSYPFRQGAIATLNVRNLFNGRMGDRAREAKAMVMALSKGNYDRIQAELRNHPLYDFAEEVGLHLVSREALSIGATSAQKEESFASNLAEKIPGVLASERAYTAAADTQRLQMFATFVEELERAGVFYDDVPQAYTDVARFVNNITGRGELPKALDSLAPLLSSVMFSPRYLASRVRVMNPAYYAQMSVPARKLAMKEMAGFFSMLAIVLSGAAMAGASVGLDPDDADFLKIKIGNTRYDLLAGLQQVGVFAFRVLKRMVLHAAGKPLPQNQRTIGDIASRFARSKASPVAGYFYDWLVAHKHFDGKPFEQSRGIPDLIIPIMWGDFYEAAKAEGWTGIVKTAPSIVGVSVNTYKPREPKKPASGAKPKLSPTAQARRELLRR